MRSKPYDDDQQHPSGITGKDVIPDTHANTDIGLTQRGPGHGDTHYIPGDGFLISHGGFSKKSKGSIYDEKKQEILATRPKSQFGKALHDQGTYLSESEILEYAATIQAHRAMTSAVDRKEAAFAQARERLHAGTDAVDSAKDGFHKQSDEFDIDKSRSTVFIGITSSGPPGIALNGSKVYHHNMVSLTVTGPDGRRICDVRMSLEQFASALVSNTHVPCTLSRYWSVSDDNVLLTERVRRPVSIRKRMAARIEGRLQEQDDKIHEIVRELRERADSGKSMSKTMLQDIAKRLSWAAGHSTSNVAFTVGQAQEEITGIMESAALQFIGQQTINPRALWEAAGPALDMSPDETPLLPGPDCDVIEGDA